MLPETHPLFEAEMFLLHWFEKAPKDHSIEFYVIASETMKNPKLPKSQAIVCFVSNLEKSFDVAMAGWIQARNAEGYHAYFGVCPRATVNHTAEGHATHARKEDVLVSVGAWVDIDKPHWRSILDSEKPPATFITSTGKGCHLYFRYAEPKVVSESVDDCKALMARYSGDHCFDGPRVLRLPGTKNWKKDTVEQMCTLLRADLEKVFTGIPKLAPPPTKTEGGAIDIPKVFDKFGGDWELREAVIGGYDKAAALWPQIGPGADGSVNRSAMDFVVMKKLSIHGCMEEEIHAIFHDPGLGIAIKSLEELDKQGSDHYFEVTLRKATAAATAEKCRSGDIGEIAIFEGPEELSKAPKLDFAVERILPVGGYCVLSGQAKAGKSLAATDLMLLMAGVPGKFLGRLTVNHTGVVGYAQAEITRPSLKFRLNTIGASRGVKWEQFPINVFTGRFNLMSNQHRDAVIRGLQKIKAKYFVLDPLARFHFGNENRHGDMMTVLTNLETIAEECDLFGVIVIHHHGKPGEQEKSGVQQMRGSTVIGDWGNAHVLLSKQWTQSNGKKFIKVQFELRDAEEVEPLSLALNSATLRHERFTEAEERLATVQGLRKTSDTNDREAVVNAAVEQLGIKKSKAEELVDKAEAIEAKELRAKLAGNGHDHDGEVPEEVVEGGGDDDIDEPEPGEIPADLPE